MTDNRFENFGTKYSMHFFLLSEERYRGYTSDKMIRSILLALIWLTGSTGKFLVQIYQNFVWDDINPAQSLMILFGSIEGSN